MVGTHIVRSYQEALDKLKRHITQMGHMVEEQLAKVIEAVHGRDSGLAQQAYIDDNDVDALEQEIDDLTLNLLALRQPMALDLRLIVSAIKIVRDLERIGDYAANMAKRTKILNAHPLLDISAKWLHMATLVQPLVKNAIDAFAHQSVDIADTVIAQDSEVDRAYEALCAQIMTQIEQSPALTRPLVSLFLMAKDLERIGDRSTNIAEQVHFISTGQLPHRQRHSRKVDG